MTQSGSVSFFCFFLIELNRQFTLVAFLTKSSRSSAGHSLDQLSPPHRGPSCTLHPTCAPCTPPGCIGWIGDWWVVLERGDWACSLLTHPTHRHTHIHSQGQASISSLSLSFTHTLEKQRRRQGGESVGVTASGCCQAVVI